jgi:hypothetical protein
MNSTPLIAFDQHAATTTEQEEAARDLLRCREDGCCSTSSRCVTVCSGYGVSAASTI